MSINHHYPYQSYWLRVISFRLPLIGLLKAILRPLKGLCKAFKKVFYRKFKGLLKDFTRPAQGL